MNNLHKPVMLNEIKSFLPNDKSINVIDATFGGGGYSKAILENFSVNQLLAIDRDPIAKIFAKDLEGRYHNFSLVNDRFSRIDKIVEQNKLKEKKFDFIIFDLGTSSNQIDNNERGFSFNNDGPLDMRMGLGDKNAIEIVNKYNEKELAKIIYEYGEERYSRIIAREIVKSRKIKYISKTSELSNIIKKCIPKKISIIKKFIQLQKHFRH